MALSRIWSAFIIIAILVAGIKFIAGSEPQVFASMVTGKKGDSVQVKQMQLDYGGPPARLCKRPWTAASG